jgi:hypothetical protein
MTHLKALSFTTIQKGSANPALTRRSKLISRLEEQKALAQDANFVPVVKRWVKGADGNKQLVELQRPVRAWWRTDVTGATVFTVRYGFKTVEFEKGKAGVAVPSIDKLVSVIDTLIAAVRAGELDGMLEQHSRARAVPKSKRAA